MRENRVLFLPFKYTHGVALAFLAARHTTVCLDVQINANNLNIMMLHK